MRNFLKVADGVNVMPLRLELQRQPELWNQHRLRKDAPGTPHSEMSDIWVRYNAIEKAGPSFNDEHFPVWYPAYYCLPSIKKLVFDLMTVVEGEHLGGVLITKVPPGCRIEKHVDRGWHVEFYDKFYLSLTDAPVPFHCEDETIVPRMGELWWFDNRKEHWTLNETNEDRMTLIVCIRTHYFKGRA